MRILIVEDEATIAKNISEVFQSLGYAFSISPNAEDALYQVEVEDFDAVILDWMLPDMNGGKLLEKMRKMGVKSPVIFLTAKSSIENKVTGLSLGADDYLTKPFVMEELVERVKALIRRKEGVSKSPVIVLGDLSLDTNARKVFVKGKFIDLSPKEYSIIEYLAFNEGKAVSRLDIMNHVWGEEIDPFSNTVDVHVRYLRRKIESGRGYLLETVKGVGYMLCKS